MTDIRFYHLTTQNLDQALPVILTKGLSTGKKIAVMVNTAKDMTKFDDLLWTYKADSFLPHTTDKDAYPEHQPVLISTSSQNQNNANMLVLCDVKDPPDNVGEFSLICDFIDGGNDDSIESGRARWKTYKEKGFALTYWQQNDGGGWEQKA